MKRKSVIILIAIVLTAVTLSVEVTYGYWDTISGRGGVNLNTGEWGNKEIDKSFEDFINDNLYNDWTKDENGNLIIKERNPVYENYTEEELKEAVDILEEFYENFLETATENGKTITKFPDRATVSYVDIDMPDYIAPGEKVQIAKIIDFSNFSQDIYWAPVLISMAIEQTEGLDISDYMIEILPDYNAMQSFKYSYLYVDREMGFYNNYEGNFAQGDAQVTVSESLYLKPGAYTDITVNKLNGKFDNSDIYRGPVPLTDSVTYRHRISVTGKTGNYGRLPSGLKPTINTPIMLWDNSGKSFYTQYMGTVGESEGLFTIGKQNGKRSELRMSFDSRVPIVIGHDTNGNPVYQSSIPVIINISRGVQVDGNGVELAQQNASTAVPTIKFKIVQGQNWNLEED